jgi:hypothetical protein
MPLVMQYNGPYATPQVLCDYCGEVIPDAQEGNYQWAEEEMTEGTSTPLYFTHKRCCDAFETTRGGGQHWSAIGLECLPYYLVKNLKSSWRAAQAQGAMMSRR